jgi:hypothetical protein
MRVDPVVHEIAADESSAAGDQEARHRLALARTNANVGESDRAFATKRMRACASAAGRNDPLCRHVGAGIPGPLRVQPMCRTVQRERPRRHDGRRALRTTRPQRRSGP